VELLITISIIGILSSTIISTVRHVRDSARFVTAQKELLSIRDALELYADDHGGAYPDDADRDIPPGLEEYLAPGLWPNSAWPGSVFDWENWNNPDTGEKIYQISIRFCPIGQPEECQFPNEEWAEEFDIDSSVYYCIQGSCRAHINKPVSHPGYCVNCGE